MRTLVLALLCGACLTSSSRPYVHTLRLAGRQLVVEKCPIEFDGDNVRPLLRECTTTTIVLPEPEEKP